MDIKRIKAYWTCPYCGAAATIREGCLCGLCRACPKCGWED